jgi:branched-chain amino acid transport system substrate-binding protein
MKLSKIIGIVVILLILGVVIGGSHNRKSSDSTDPIRIGASLSLTGVAADFGDMSKKAMELAVAEINENGGMEGRKVELYIEDDKTAPQDALSAYRKLVDIDHVDAVVGGLFDFTAQPLFPLAQNEKVTFVSPVNFAIEDSFVLNDYIFVMYPTFESVVRQLKDSIDKKGVKQMSMLRFQSDFSAEIEETIEEVLTELNKPALITETYPEIGNSSFRTPIVKLKEKNPDAIFLDMLDFDISRYLVEAKNLGFTPQLFAYTTLRDVLDKGETDPALLEGAIMLDWEIPSDDFTKRFEAKYSEKPRRGADKSYDAVYMLAEAIAHADSAEEVPEYIEEHTFKTPNATFSFTDDHAGTDLEVKVWEVKDGKLVEFE